jgi:hypothetical protein
MRFPCRYLGVSRIGSHKTVTKLDKVAEITMWDRTQPPRKLTTLRHKYMDLRTSEDLEVFHIVIPRVETTTHGPTIDCLNLAGNAMVKDLSAKISVYPSAWWWHVFQHHGYNKRTARSLVECFKMEAAYVADQFMFDKSTGTVTPQFANDGDFLNRMDNELALDEDKDMLKDSTNGSTPCTKSTIEISDIAKASLASALDDPNMDLAADSHASAKSRCTNFSSSTGNSSNQSVNTKQYAINHKSHSPALAIEIRKTAQLEHESREMVCRLQELETLCSSGPNQRGAPSSTDSSPNEHLKSPPEAPMEEPPQSFDNGPHAMRGGYNNTVAYKPILSDFQTQNNSRHALGKYGEPLFESEAEREHTTRSYIKRDRRAICMGLNIPYFPIDVFDNDNELWITANCKAALQMTPDDRSYTESVTFEQVVFANKN